MALFLGDIWLEVALGLVALSIIFYRLWTKDYNYWKDRNVPYIKPSFPFGNLKDFLLRKKFLGTLFKEMHDELEGHRYGGFITVRLPSLLVRDPEIIKQFLTKDFHHFTDRGITLPDERSDPLSAHLFNLKGDRWRILRSKLTPTFTSGKMKMMFSLMNGCGKELQKSLIQHAEKGDIIELKDYMARFGTDVIGNCAFGLDIDSINHPDNEFRRITKNVLTPTPRLLLRNVLNMVSPSLSRFIKIKTISNEIEGFFFKIVGDTVEYREKKNVQRNDFLDLLIQIKNKGHLDDDANHPNDNTQNGYQKDEKSLNEIELTKELMTAQCFVFFVAGFETSSTTLSFCLYELASNKDIQNKLQQEIDKVLERHNGESTYEALKEMTYMDQVVQETLRKYPPVSTLTRECTSNNYILPDTNVEFKKGMRVSISIFGVHYDPEFYPNPEHFDPERFTEEAKASRPHYTWLPFGEGPRICIGMRFGLLQIKTALTALLSKYNFDLPSGAPKKLELSNKSITTSPVGGIMLKITNRK